MTSLHPSGGSFFVAFFTVIGLINGGYIQKRFHDSGSPEERAGVNAWLFSKLFDIDLKDFPMLYGATLFCRFDPISVIIDDVTASFWRVEVSTTGVCAVSHNVIFVYMFSIHYVCYLTHFFNIFTGK
jgi:hypothetical protein